MRITNVLFKYLFLLLAIITFSAFPIQSAFSQFACVPTCDITDGRFMSLAGFGLQTTNNTDAFFHLTSRAGSTDLDMGIFDGDGRGANVLGVTGPDKWDTSGGGVTEVEYTLFFDPSGDGLGIGNGVVYRTWTSDGSSGDNMGSPMPDNDWFVSIIPNDPQAQTAVGSFSYVLRAVNVAPVIAGINVFKIRSDGTVSVPAGEAFNYVVSFSNITDIQTLYPNFDFADPTCFNPAVFGPVALFCSPNDPACCLHESTYDGTWEFVFNVPEDLTTLDIWDGDLDFGSASLDPNDNTICIVPDGIAVDTDDPNTPIALPPWAIGTDAIQQSASVPTGPPDDDACGPPSLRSPSVFYELIDPDGLSYFNVNPSGNIEWELFNLSTEPFDPMLYDIHVDDIPPGEWRVLTTGNDLQNQNSMRVPFAICGLDEQGDTFCPTVLLDVTILGDGDGTVVSDSPAILCSSLGDDNCEELYDLGALVTLTATPEPLSDFVGWSGDPACTGDPTNPVLNLQMDMDISCIATFALLPVLDVIIEGNGVCTVTSEPAGIDCPDDCEEVIDPRGTTVTLTAVPDEISTFIDWTGDCNDDNPTTSITVNEDSTCIATCITQFVLNPIFPALD
ncbi:MAG: hypothetical protein WBB48_00385, partial [Thermodesulfobacteriota bacterium]